MVSGRGSPGAWPEIRLQLLADVVPLLRPRFYTCRLPGNREAWEYQRQTAIGSHTRRTTRGSLHSHWITLPSDLRALGRNGIEQKPSPQAPHVFGFLEASNRWTWDTTKSGSTSARPHGEEIMLASRSGDGVSTTPTRSACSEWLSTRSSRGAPDAADGRKTSCAQRVWCSFACRGGHCSYVCPETRVGTLHRECRGIRHVPPMGRGARGVVVEICWPHGALEAVVYRPTLPWCDAWWRETLRGMHRLVMASAAVWDEAARCCDRSRGVERIKDVVCRWRAPPSN